MSPTRKLIIRYLTEHGELPSTKLAEMLGIEHKSLKEILTLMHRDGQGVGRARWELLTRPSGYRYYTAIYSMSEAWAEKPRNHWTPEHTRAYHREYERTHPLTAAQRYRKRERDKLRRELKREEQKRDQRAKISNLPHMGRTA